MLRESGIRDAFTIFLIAIIGAILYVCIFVCMWISTVRVLVVTGLAGNSFSSQRRLFSRARWRAVAEVVRVRPYALFWQGYTAMRLYHPQGCRVLRDQAAWRALVETAYTGPYSLRS